MRKARLVLSLPFFLIGTLIETIALPFNAVGKKIAGRARLPRDRNIHEAELRSHTYFQTLTGHPWDQSDWDFCKVLRRKRLIDGTYGDGVLMRRRGKGEWQYRRLTRDEESEWVSVKLPNHGGRSEIADPFARSGRLDIGPT